MSHGTTRCDKEMRTVFTKMELLTGTNEITREDHNWPIRLRLALGILSVSILWLFYKCDTLCRYCCKVARATWRMAQYLVSCGLCPACFIIITSVPVCY